MMRIKLIIFCCITLFAATNSFAQSGKGGLKVYVKCGKIGNDGCSVTNAKIILRPIENWSKSTDDVSVKIDKDGYFSADVSFGEYELIISADGYDTYQTTFYISSSVELKWGVRLHPSESDSKKTADSIRLFQNCKDAFAKKDYNKAIEACGEAIKADSTQSEAYFYRAESIRKNSAFQGFMYLSDQVKKLNLTAIEDYTIFLKAKPDNADALKGRGILSVRVAKYDSAIEDLTKIILGGTTDAEVYLSRGNAFYNTGNFQLSVLDYTKALQLDKKPDILRNRANAYKKLNQKAEWCQDSRAINPSFDCEKEWQR